MTVLALRQDKDAMLAQLAVDIRQHLHTSAASAIEAGRMFMEAKRCCRTATGCRGCATTSGSGSARRRTTCGWRVTQMRSVLRIYRPCRARAAAGREESEGDDLPRRSADDHADHPHGRTGCIPAPNGTSDLQHHQRAHQLGWVQLESGDRLPPRVRILLCREIALPPTTAAHFPAGFTPLFHHERLLAPANTKVPADAADDPRRKRVFVCSMADLYGRWVPREWIVAVHEACIAFSSGTI
jgi:hypothetical protein